MKLFVASLLLTTISCSSLSENNTKQTLNLEKNLKETKDSNGPDKDSLYKRACYLLELDTEDYESNYVEAFELLETSCSMGYDSACTRLGYEYLNGLKIKKNIKKGLEYLDIANKNGEARASFELYLFHFMNKDFKKAENYLNETYKRNKSLASYDLYDLYMNGKCFSCGNPDIKSEDLIEKNRAISYLKEAACYEICDAYFDLGIYYLKGYKMEIKIDSSLAKCCFNKALELSSDIPGYADNVEYYLKNNIGENWGDWLKEAENSNLCSCENIKK